MQFRNIELATRHRTSVLRLSRHLVQITVAIVVLGNFVDSAARAIPARSSQQSRLASMTGRELYQAGCAACHGSDGRGMPQSIVGFEEPLPDFTDCRFASREADADWTTVTTHGGPARSFSQMMPAFGDALTQDQILSIITHIRTFCNEPAWPRGEFNLPRPLVTEKAFPEDEAVLNITIAAEGPALITNQLIYEKRFGARNQVELVFPIIARRQGNGIGWTGGFGDVGFAYKRSMFYSLRTGSILTFGGEATLATGNEAKGMGAGTTVFEPFVAFGQILPSDGFVHFQGGSELPTRGTKEAFWRVAAGRSFAQQGGLGRTWTPIIEMVGARELTSGAQNELDLVPQLQITLSKRQHILMNIGARLPVVDRNGRHTEVMMYLLWDWFDGGLRDGW